MKGVVEQEHPMYRICALSKRLGLACLIVFGTGFFDEAGGKAFNSAWDWWYVAKPSPPAVCTDPLPYDVPTLDYVDARHQSVLEKL